MFTKSGCALRARRNVVATTRACPRPPMYWSHRITAVNALAAFHQPVLRHRPVDGTYQRCSARTAAAARAWEPGPAMTLTLARGIHGHGNRTRPARRHRANARPGHQGAAG